MRSRLLQMRRRLLLYNRFARKNNCGLCGHALRHACSSFNSRCIRLNAAPVSIMQSSTMLLLLAAVLAFAVAQDGCITYDLECSPARRSVGTCSYTLAPRLRFTSIPIECAGGPLPTRNPGAAPFGKTCGCMVVDDGMSILICMRHRSPLIPHLDDSSISFRLNCSDPDNARIELTYESSDCTGVASERAINSEFPCSRVGDYMSWTCDRSGGTVRRVGLISMTGLVHVQVQVPVSTMVILRQDQDGQKVDDGTFAAATTGCAQVFTADKCDGTAETLCDCQGMEIVCQLVGESPCWPSIFCAKACPNDHLHQQKLVAAWSNWNARVTRLASTPMLTLPAPTRLTAPTSTLRPGHAKATSSTPVAAGCQRRQWLL